MNPSPYQSADDLVALVRDLSEKLGERVAAGELGISRAALRRARKCGIAVLSKSTRARPARDGAVSDPRGCAAKTAAELATCNQEHEVPTRSGRLAIRPEPEDC
jgi:hypothetical protein